MVARSRVRFILLWGIFAATGLATSLAILRLYQTAQQEITAQSERALQQEAARFSQRVQASTEEVHRSIIAELASFHLNGLGASLHQWDEANEFILGTFEWEPTRGFLEGSRIPATAPSPETLARFWREFRDWRNGHPAESKRKVLTSDDWQNAVYATTDNIAFSANDLGYQSENLEIVTHAGRRADPWAGWVASETQPDAPWIFWYQPGPDEPVRGCFVDGRPIVQQLRSELKDTAYARLELVAIGLPMAPNSLGSSAASVPGLPAYRISSSAGDVFVEKSVRAQTTAIIVALLLGVFLLGATALTVFTRRSAREAERKINFVTQVSHELRTPLTSIRLFADMLATPELDPSKRIKFASTISTESGRLGALIERLLAFNALEKNKKKVAQVKLEVTSVVRNTVDEMDARLRAAGLSVALNLPAPPVFALCDQSTLKQALLNLLDNATKYAPNSGPLVIEVVGEATHVRLRVADRGPGVTPAMREQIFEPFVQGGQALTNKSPGVGLGLSIARGMLRQAGADLVLLDSSPGAVFEIRLPRAEPTLP